ncbi:hypothetical protein ACFSQ7_34410 [Paenibacillus rhizoplanae]
MAKKSQESGSTRRMIMTLLKKRGAADHWRSGGRAGHYRDGCPPPVLQLEQESLVRTKVVRQAMGRPMHVYSLTERAEDHFPKSYRQSGAGAAAGAGSRERGGCGQYAV